MGGIARDRTRQVEIDFGRVEWQGRQKVDGCREADGYLRQQERRLPGNGGRGVKDEVERQKGAERKRVVLGCERGTPVEGMVVETPGEQRSARQGSRWGPGMAPRE
jgi:hypothetical protein